MAPDEEALANDLRSCRFRVGERRAKWQLVRVTFPLLFVRVRAAGRADSPDWFLLRLDCTGYPAAAPTAQLWNGQTNCAIPLQERPHGKNGVLVAFSAWQACLYHPIDRMARMHWPDQHTELAWAPGKDITLFLETVHGLLNDPEYVVSKASAAAAFMPDEALETHPA
jgi:hypothetical protein